MKQLPVTDNSLPVHTSTEPLDQATVANMVNSYLEEFYAQTIDRAKQLDMRSAELWQALRQVTLAGGKRLRPYVLILAYQAYGGKDIMALLPIAVAQELLHVSLLIHDDIIDKDTVRHGQLNVSGMMEQQYAQLTTQHDLMHYANGAALLGGDLLIGAAHSLIGESQLSDQDKLVALKELSNAIFYVGAGEFLDMESSLRSFDQTDALHIINLKTSHYSFIVPLRSGARLAGATENEAQLLDRFGAVLGAAFQLTDDLLGVFGNEALTGKTVIGDIREGKHTFLVERGMKLGSTTERHQLAEALGNSQLTATQLENVKQLLEHCGAKAETLRQITNYSTEAIALLQLLSISAQSKAAFMAVIEHATKRVL